MTDFAKLLAGGESDTAAIVPGKPDDSYLLDQITPDSDGRADMPKDRPVLSASEIQLIRTLDRAGSQGRFGGARSPAIQCRDPLNPARAGDPVDRLHRPMASCWL